MNLRRSGAAKSAGSRLASMDINICKAGINQAAFDVESALLPFLDFIHITFFSCEITVLARRAQLAEWLVWDLCTRAL